MKRVCLAVMMAILCSEAHQVKAESLGDKIGEVAAHLYSAAITDTVGSGHAAGISIGWDRALIAKSKYPTNVPPVTFQDFHAHTYDAVKRVYSVGADAFETKQTFGVWTLTLLNQATEGKSDQELATLVTALSFEYLNAFTNRSFTYAGTYDGIKVFILSIDPGHETGDWRDLVKAVVNGTSVGYSCIKKRIPRPAGRISDDPFKNRVWFFSVESEIRIKRVPVKAQVILKPEALKVSPGVLTAHIRLPEGYPARNIVFATCDEAIYDEMMLSDDETEMIVKFRRKDIEEALGRIRQSLDTNFVVRGIWRSAAGTNYFEGTASIKKIVGAK